MRRNLIITLIGSFLCFIYGCTAITVKQLSRNNLNQETISQIELCRTTKKEIVKLFRVPTDDFKRRQNKNEIYVYKGFAGRMKLEKQLLEVMFNEHDIVVDLRFNHEGTGPMDDQCQLR